MQALGMAPPRKKLQASSDLVNRILRNATDGAAPPASSAEPPHAAHVHALASQQGSDANAPPANVAAVPVESEAPTNSAAAAAARGPGGTDRAAAEAAAAEAAAAEAAAAAALQALESGQHHADAAKRAGVVRVVEKRNFAGQEVEMEREVQAGSKAAQQAQDRAAAASNKSGLDAALANMSGV